MVNFDKLYTYDKPRNRNMYYLDILMKLIIIGGAGLVGLWFISEILFVGKIFGIDVSFLRITNQQAPGNALNPSAVINNPVPIAAAYAGLGVGFLGGAVMYVVPVILNLILAPPGGKLRTQVVDDDQYADTTYECGEPPLGSGHGQVNLQYYSFALVFIMFDIITALTLMFALVFSLGMGVNTTINVNGISYTPDSSAVVTQIIAILFFVLSPLFVLGFWLKKKAILWQ